MNMKTIENMLDPEQARIVNGLKGHLGLHANVTTRDIYTAGVKRTGARALKLFDTVAELAGYKRVDQDSEYEF
ncbi:Uncharacterised protein [Candidatus Tiddalikarchaeum anstoanum]|nr:Uncharacterised protein [Candidatus Tiddalikarchaeum anstoanum]